MHPRLGCSDQEPSNIASQCAETIGLQPSMQAATCNACRWAAPFAPALSLPLGGLRSIGNESAATRVLVRASQAQVELKSATVLQGKLVQVRWECDCAGMGIRKGGNFLTGLAAAHPAMFLGKETSCRVAPSCANEEVSLFSSVP